MQLAAFVHLLTIIVETMKVCRSEASLEINAKPYLHFWVWTIFWDIASEWWIAASFSDCQRQFKDLLIVNVKRCIFEQRGTASLIYLILSKSLKVLKYQILSCSDEKIYFFTREGGAVCVGLMHVAQHPKFYYLKNQRKVNNCKKEKENKINKILGTCYFSLLKCCSEYKLLKIHAEQTSFLVVGMSIEFITTGSSAEVCARGHDFVCVRSGSDLITCQLFSSAPMTD